MPYSIKKNFGKCADTSKPYAVVKDSDQKVMGCHSSRGKAQSQIAAIESSERMKIYKINGEIPEDLLEIDPTEPIKAAMSFMELPDTQVLSIVGAPFGGHISGRDRDGEAFHVKTDIGLALGDEVLLTYFHGFGPDSLKMVQNPPQWIGKAVYTGISEKGHMFQARLNHQAPLTDRILQNTNIKASSGAVKHLIRHNPNDKGMVDVWPVGELAVFDVNDIRVPANDLATVEIKRDRAYRSYIVNLELAKLRTKLTNY